MFDIGYLLIFAIRIFTFLLIVRLIIEMTRSFSRNFQAPRWFSLLAEPIFIVTDPPVKLLRRFIPPIRLGNVLLDVSVLVLFFALTILQFIIGTVMIAPNIPGAAG